MTEQVSPSGETGRPPEQGITATVQALTFRTYGWFIVRMIAFELLLGVALAARTPGTRVVMSAILVAVAVSLFATFRRCRSFADVQAAVSRRISGHVSVTDDALFIGGELVVRRADLTSGLVQARPGGAARLVLRAKLTGRSAGFLPIDLASAADADALARELGTDVSRQTARFVVWSPRAQQAKLAVLGLVVATTLAVAAAIGFFPLVGIPALVVLTTVMALTLVLASQVVRVGADGVWHRGGFVPFRDVKRIEDDGRVVELQLSDGRSLRWHAGDVGAGMNGVPGTSSMLAARLREALLAYRSSASDDPGASLARAGRTEAEWRRSLRAIGSGEARGYRVAPPSRERLLQLVADPAADAELREAAAIAVGGSLDDEARDRLRAAAEVTVAPELRAAFEREARGEPELHGEALLEPDEADEDRRRHASPSQRM